ERFGTVGAMLDPRMRGKGETVRREAWFMDKYRHPHETKHSINEVLGWFDAAGFDFMSSVPSIGDQEFSEDSRLFEPHSARRLLDRLSTEVEMLLSGGADGGLYIMIGRTRPYLMRMLGISAYYHDSAAALVEDGRIVAAAQEERFTRKKFDERFPQHAIRYCLDAGGVTLADVDHVVFYDKPLLKFERLVETYLAYGPRGFASYIKALPVWLGEKLFQGRLLTDELKRFDPDFGESKLLFTEHHHSHAASAFYPSPFEEALILTLDGVGEWCTTTAAVGKG